MKDGRAYQSPVRAAQTARTRAAVLESAHRLFLAEGGYATTSMSAVAAASGVSVQTLYNLFGGKAALLKAVYDSTLAGDDAAVPMRERPEFVAMQEEPDPVRLLERYAAIGARLADRVGPLYLRVREGAAAGDPDLAELVATSGRERLAGATGVVTRLRTLTPLRTPLTPQRAKDIVWTQTSLEVWDLLVTQRGWSAAAYVDFVAASMCRGLLPSDLHGAG